MPGESTSIHRISTSAEFEEFARFPFAVFRDADAWWPPDPQSEIDLLSGRSPISRFLDLEPLCARRDGVMVARVTAVVNRRYIEHWNERLGQLIHFEALDDEDAAVGAMLARAADWLRARGMLAARSGFSAFLDYPYAIDNYSELSSFLLRANSPSYHRYFKNSGFETEKGQVDYTVELTPEILTRYRSIVEAGAASGLRVRSWREYGYFAAVDEWAEVTNAAFARHWGWNPVTREEVRPMLTALWNTPVADVSMIASDDAGVIGAVFSVPDLSATLARVKRGVRIHPSRGGGTRGALINIGVLARARGRGVAAAMTARSYLAMASRGMTYAGYTLVLDDNWASRRTAQSLGARVTGNFLTYRRAL